MRTEEARPVRLEDYRPPDWIVETVELDVRLDPVATRVRATLTLRPNGNGAAPAPLVLDGDALDLRALKLDGAALPPEQFVATADRLTIAQPPHRPFRLEIETVVDPSANTQLMGLYRSGRDLLHPVRGGRLPPHHLFPRPPRCHGGLHHPHRGRESRRAGAARQWKSHCLRRRAGHEPPFRRLAGSVPEAVIPVRTGRRKAGLRRGPLSHHVGSRGDASHLCRGRQGSTLRLRDGLAQARHALGRDGIRPRIRSRYFHDRRRVRLQHGGDGEQGPQCLQRQIRARLAGNGDRRRFRSDRGDHRPRILSQLDRQSHHLPRLVPALPKGRAHGFSRSGVLGRCALARGRAHQRRARPARSPVRRRRRPPRPSRAPPALP